MSARVFEGDCLDVMANMPDNHFDAIVKRFGKEGAAPAQFGADGAFARASRGFMGKEWDGGDIAFRPETWAEALRIMKPGAHLVAFGAPKNYHRLACAIEDAGFEIRDSIFWCFGSGFPKSHNLDGDWKGWGTALKPAYEPIVLARKPLSEKTVAANVLRWGTGALNIDACRIEGVKGVPASPCQQDSKIYGKGASLTKGDTAGFDPNAGRWPANLCHDGSQGVLDLFPHTKSGTISPDNVRTTSKTKNAYGERKAPSEYFPGDEGSAARFFYCPKASKQDRAGSKHPTVKPINLMRWLIRMVTPPNGIILDPFGGSGTTGEAAMCEGISAILIEREAEYISDIKRRIEAAE